MFDLQAQRDMNKGFGDGLTRAVELVLTPLVFAGIGYGVDSLVGTRPVFMVGLAVVALLGMIARFWYGYDHEMRQHEASASWRRGADRRAESADDLWGDRDTTAGEEVA